MIFSNTISAPSSFNPHMLVSDGKFEYSLSEAVTSMFVAYFADDYFADLEQTERSTVANIYKELLHILVKAEADAIKWNEEGNIGPLPEISISPEFYDRFSNFWDTLKALKILDQAFLAFLSEDVGNDLSPEGYVNTNVAMAKRALFDLFEDLLRSNVEAVLSGDKQLAAA
jgi:hypothetical protein